MSMAKKELLANKVAQNYLKKIININTQAPQPLVIFMFSLLLIIIPIENTFAAVKSGSSCSQPGSSAISGKIKFKCIKSGKKYIWVKSPKVISKEAIGVKPPVFVFTPWSVSVTKQQLVSQALQNYQNWVKQNQGTSTNLNVYQDERVDLNHRKMIQTSSQHAQEIFIKFLDKPYKLFVAKDDLWIKNKLSEINMISPPGESICPGGNSVNSYCAGSDHGFFIIRSENSLQLLQKSDYQTPGHEYFHTVQSKVGGNLSLFPAWFKEGTANFIGTAISDELRYQDYLITRDEEVIKPWTNRPQPLEDFKLNNSQAGLSNWLSPYGIGQVATEFIVASTGLDSLLNIFKYTNELNDFSLGFTKATSIELTQFYKLFDQGRVLWGIQAVS